MLAVTDESASETEPFVEQTNMQYAYAYDKGGKLARYFGVRGIPHAVLIDASGNVAWSGHPAALEDAQITAATKGSLKRPTWEWTAAAKPVRSALVKNDLGNALKLAAKLSPADRGAEILADVEGLVAARVEAMKAAHERGDFRAAQEAALALQKGLAGRPEGAEAARVAGEIAADAKALDVIKGQEKVAKIRAKDVGKRKDREAAIEDLRKLKKAHPGTYVETEVDALLRHYAEIARNE